VTPSVQKLEHLGIDHLINEDDKMRLRQVNTQIKNYLDELTSESSQANEGLLSARIAPQIAQKLTEEMK
jgi:hypothetical protein